MNYRCPDPQEEKQKVKASELLEADRVRLLMDQPFVGAILIRQNLIPVVDFRCPTAATDGQSIFVNPDFYLSLKPAERRFLLAHEVWHTIFLHFLRCQGRQTDLFNMAADMEVNRLLASERFKVPEGALLPPDKWHDLNAEEIYEQLCKQPPSSSRNILDAHLEKGVDDVPGMKDPDPEENSQTVVIDPDYQVDFGNDPEGSIREKVVEAAVQYEKHRGTLPGNIARIVEGFRGGKLHWKELLAQFVTSCFGGRRVWLPPNRRYIAKGLYLQSRRDSKLQAVLAIDTSGSTQNSLQRFAEELVNLLGTFGQYELKVICCDSRIRSVESFTADTPFDGKKIKFKGGGGTSFTPVFDFLKENPPEAQILLYFTDGYGDQPRKPPYPVMWVITPDGKNSIFWGCEIKLDK